MQRLRRYSLILAFLVVGGFIGVYLAQLTREEAPSQAEAEEPAGRADRGPGVPADPREVLIPEQFSPTIEIPYPAGAIRGEMALRFRSREDYRAYLAALRRAGLAPLGQIDELLTLRVDEEALAALDPLRYGATPDYSYAVERPPPPKEVSPEALAMLQAYGRSAREIVGGPVEGDGSGVLVGILDSGIAAHPQFDDVYIVHVDLAGGGVAGPGAAHGTSVASIITGTEGVAPEAELFVVRVLDDEGLGNSFHVAEGIVQAADLGVQVMNLSLGLYQDSQVLREAVRYAQDKGMLLVAAAGNDGFGRLPYPAGYPEVVSVTAIDAAERQALFPNQSERIDFAAPGVGILTAKDDEGTELFTGTSAAAPFVTGTVAALLSADPDLTGKGAVEILRRHRNEAGAGGVDPVYGGGILDWNRVRERKMAGIADLALAEIYLAPDARPGTTMPVTLTVENRGTRWLSGAEMTVLVNDRDPVEFSIEAIGPGQTATRKVYTSVPSENDETGLEVAAQVLTEAMTDDVRPENNQKAVSYRPRAAE
ncbi:MAG: S8 family peptidase [Opitutales bacterium]